jgi:hypothetical protein
MAIGRRPRSPQQDWKHQHQEEVERQRIEIHRLSFEQQRLEHQNVGLLKKVGDVCLVGIVPTAAAEISDHTYINCGNRILSGHRAAKLASGPGPQLPPARPAAPPRRGR